MSRESMLKLLKEREESMKSHLDRLKSEQSLPSQNDYIALVNQYMQKNPGFSRAEAMRQVTRKHPDKHAAWIREVNSQK